jgi:hypothetical protein
MGKHVVDGHQDLLGIRLLFRLPADSLLPGQTPAQEASCETFSNTLMSTPNSAMIAAARVASTPGIPSSSVTWFCPCDLIAVTSLPDSKRKRNAGVFLGLRWTVDQELLPANGHQAMSAG